MLSNKCEKMGVLRSEKGTGLASPSLGTNVYGQTAGGSPKSVVLYYYILGSVICGDHSFILGTVFMELVSRNLCTSVDWLCCM